MSGAYKIRYTNLFDRSYVKLVKKNKSIEEKIKKTIRYLQQDPFYRQLKTHKVNSRLHGKKYSSSVTGDIRIIWDFDDDIKVRIILINIGGHSGKNKVYS